MNPSFGHGEEERLDFSCFKAGCGGIVNTFLFI